jgi:hypothetical protein
MTAMKTMFTSFSDILISTVRHALVKLTEPQARESKKENDYKKKG